jgi:hypothetical protein
MIQQRGALVLQVQQLYLLALLEAVAPPPAVDRRPCDGLHLAPSREPDHIDVAQLVVRRTRASPNCAACASPKDAARASSDCTTRPNVVRLQGLLLACAG